MVFFVSTWQEYASCHVADNLPSPSLTECLGPHFGAEPQADSSDRLSTFHVGQLWGPRVTWLPASADRSCYGNRFDKPAAGDVGIWKGSLARLGERR